MFALQNQKVVNAIPPVAIKDNASWTAAAVDCLGFAVCRFDVILGATDIAMAALKVQESNDDGSSDAYADVAGAIFGTSLDIAGVASVLPTADDGGKVFSIILDCRKRKRYLKLVATAGNGSTGTFAAAIATLANPAVSRDTAAEQGCGNILRV